MVHDVVTHVPQAVRRERRHEHQPTQPAVELAVRRETLMAGVVAQNEEPPDHQASQRPGQQLQRRVRQQHGGDQYQRECGQVNRHQRQRMGRVFAGHRLQPFTIDFAVRNKVGADSKNAYAPLMRPIQLRTGCEKRY